MIESENAMIGTFAFVLMSLSVIVSAISYKIGYQDAKIVGYTEFKEKENAKECLVEANKITIFSPGIGRFSCSTQCKVIY